MEPMMTGQGELQSDDRNANESRCVPSLWTVETRAKSLTDQQWQWISQLLFTAQAKAPSTGRDVSKSATHARSAFILAACSVDESGAKLAVEGA
jgi:hypothetical protein